MSELWFYERIHGYGPEHLLRLPDPHSEDRGTQRLNSINETTGQESKKQIPGLICLY